MENGERSGSVVGILRCGAPPTELEARFGSYDAMVRRMLGTGRRSRTYAAAGGELPARPDECGAYVLTGSAAGVHDGLDWIPPLLRFIRRAAGTAPLVGLCFGHQAMALALGGRVERAATGWEIGLRRYAVAERPGWMEPDVAAVAAAASHRDQVVAAPPGARVVLRGPSTPFAALDYGDAVSFQFHPEFEPDFARALLRARPERHDAATLATAIASHEPPDDRDRIAGWIARFLDGTRG